MDREYADQYGRFARWHWWFKGRQQILETVLHRELPGGRALAIASVGCGPPETLLWLKTFAAGGSVLGLDADAHHAALNEEGVGFVVGDLESPPLRASRLDAVLALDILEH